MTSPMGRSTQGNMSSKAKHCDICGDPGVVDALITCCECKKAHEHLYCMKDRRTEAPQFWFCDECKKLVAPPPGFKKQVRFAATAPKVSSLVQSSSGGSGGQNKSASASRFNFKERSVKTGRTKYISCDEAVKLSSDANKSEQPPRAAFRSEKTLTKTPQREMTTKFVSQQSSGLKAKSAVLSPQKAADAGTLMEASKTSKRPETLMEASKTSKRPETAKSKVDIKIVGSKSQAEMEAGNSDAAISDVARNASVGSKGQADSESDAGISNVTRGVTVGSKSQAEMVAGNSDAAISDVTRNVSVGSKGQADSESAKSDAGISNVTRGVTVGGKSVRVDMETGTFVSEKHRLHIPALYAYWKGILYVPDGPEYFNEALKGHPPSRVHDKVFDSIKKLPEKIPFELVPKQEVWTDLFAGYCPDKDDIGLYFFPGTENSICKMELLLGSKDLVMRTSCLDGVELLVFSSRLLQLESQEYHGNYFLWGVFRRVAKKKPKVEKGRSDHDPLHV